MSVWPHAGVNTQWDFGVIIKTLFATLVYDFPDSLGLVLYMNWFGNVTMWYGLVPASWSSPLLTYIFIVMNIENVTL